jgi:hypothetical protein
MQVQRHEELYDDVFEDLTPRRRERRGKFFKNENQYQLVSKYRLLHGGKQFLHLR